MKKSMLMVAVMMLLGLQLTAAYRDGVVNISRITNNSDGLVEVYNDEINEGVTVKPHEVMNLGRDRGMWVPWCHEDKRNIYTSANPSLLIKTKAGSVQVCDYHWGACKIVKMSGDENTRLVSYVSKIGIEPDKWSVKLDRAHSGYNLFVDVNGEITFLT